MDTAQTKTAEISITNVWARSVRPLRPSRRLRPLRLLRPLRPSRLWRPLRLAAQTSGDCFKLRIIAGSASFIKLRIC